MHAMKAESILIIGAGTWGCSIALELARRGYTDVKLLDGTSFPSAISAGNDLNKIAEESNEPSVSNTDEDYFWNHVAMVAMARWKLDPIFAPFYHATGFIMAAVGDEAYERCKEYAKNENTPLEPLDTKDDFHRTMPGGVLQGGFPGWRGFWKRQGAGWVFASGAMRAMHAEAERLGVQFVTGRTTGRVEGLLYTTDREAIQGVRTSDGLVHTASQIILAAGASSDALLDFKQQLRPTAWTLAHIPLSAEEAALYRDLPVLYGVDRGFFIEPDYENHEMKICDEHPGYINPVVNKDGRLHSVPFARHQIPKEADTRMRHLLSETMPQLAAREFSFTRICWDADTVDRIFLIDKHPELRNLTVAVGGSGNGFMASPAIGLIVADILEGKCEERLHKMLRWRPELSANRDLWDAEGRYGGTGQVMDFREVREWI